MNLLFGLHSAAKGIIFNIWPADYNNQLNAAINFVGGTPLLSCGRMLYFYYYLYDGDQEHIIDGGLDVFDGGNRVCLIVLN